MKPDTRDYLARARRNREIAQALLDSSGLSTIRPPAREWAIVVAFYSAVHYVNGYLWEKQRFEPADHDQRDVAMIRVSELRGVHASYDRLRHLGFQARYVPRARFTRTTAEEAVRDNLTRVERAVLAALRLDT